jgi:lipid II:glycine glycyltransferase (peptidoglycan interpeptide bridge formation enzyme)
VESLSHTFLVYNIKENLEKYGKVEIFVTQKPDLILTKKNGDQVIIEVETGLSFLKNKKALYNKYIKLKEEYGDKVIFVLTDAHYRKRYEALFNESDIIFSRQELDGLFESFRN